MPIIYWAGDSTVKQNNYTTFPQTGIGQGLGLYLNKEVIISNHAENGRSTKSFLEEGRLEPIRESLKEGDFLFVQFGHNDSKSEDPARYTEPFSSFQKNLEVFIDLAIEKKAIPVCITPLTRRWFQEEHILQDNIQGEYPAAMIALAKEKQIAYIDLYQSSREYLEILGATDSQKLFMNFPAGAYENYTDGLEDNTHLRYDGAVAFAGLIAKGLKELGGEYARVLLEMSK